MKENDTEKLKNLFYEFQEMQKTTEAPQKLSQKKKDSYDNKFIE